MSVNDGLKSRIMFQGDGDPVRFQVGEPGSKSPGLASFLGGGRRFGDPGFRLDFMDTPANGDSDEQYDVEDEDEDDEVEEAQKREDLLGRLAVDSNANCGVDAADKVERGKRNDLLPSGPAGRELIVREGDMGQSSVNGSKTNAKVTVADPNGNVHYSMYNLQATQECASAQKDVTGKYGSWESLNAILSDPVTALMDDAMILPCGHSFGAGGIEKVKIMKSCYTCSQPVSEESIKPNLSLRVVVQSFRQEEELQYSHSFKRRKEGSDQHAITSGDSARNAPRSRGIQLPFSVGDRIIIKGNKRTPPRFVGRRAVVTTQCLNGWYVVKTLDNAECVKLQHCSLAKLSDVSFAKAMPIETTAPWL